MLFHTWMMNDVHPLFLLFIGQTPDVNENYTMAWLNSKALKKPLYQIRHVVFISVHPILHRYSHSRFTWMSHYNTSSLWVIHVRFQCHTWKTLYVIIPENRLTTVWLEVINVIYHCCNLKHLYSIVLNERWEHLHGLKCCKTVSAVPCIKYWKSLKNNINPNVPDWIFRQLVKWNKVDISSHYIMWICV